MYFVFSRKRSGDFLKVLFSPLRLLLDTQLPYSVFFGHVLFVPALQAEEFFDPYAIELKNTGQEMIDLSAFARGEQLPGIYVVDIYLNNDFIETRRVKFVQNAQALVPEITVKQLQDFGVNTPAFPKMNIMQPDAIVDLLEDYIPEAFTHFDFNSQRLDISIPQAALRFHARNSVDPALWDQGIMAVLMNYSVSASNSWQRENGGDTDNLFLNLGSGANIGAWRIRNYSTYSRSNTNIRTSGDTTVVSNQTQQNRWQSINTYVQRDIQSLGGQLTIGENSTPGDTFVSVPFLGIQLSSDDNMLPDSQQGFAPVVRGIANSNAQVTIRQNGVIITQTYVPPGAFAIKDLYPTASSGNLDVTIRESDGRERSFVLPFSAVPGMQREGSFRYALTGGQYRSQNEHAAQTPGFVQSSLQYGVSNTLTTYGGGIVAENYLSALLGIGQGLGYLGSISLDVTQANATLKGGSKHSGRSYRVQYAKDVFQSGTTFTLAGYRYSTRNFYDFNEVNEINLNDTENWLNRYNKRSRLQIQVNQNLGDYGNLNLTGYQQDYWQNNGKERTVSAGYTLNIASINYNLNYAQTKVAGLASDQQFSFNVQIPLSRWMPNSYASYNVTTDNQHRTSNEVGVSGMLLENNSINYSVRESYATGGVGNGGGATLDYRGSQGRVSGGYNYTQENQQVNIELSGGIVAHANGITLSQPLGDAVTLIKATGASNTSVQNQVGIHTDARGYAVVPNILTYRMNRIALEPGSLKDDVELDSAVQTVVPTKGAVVLAEFQTRIGARALLSLRHKGRPVPFGATAIVSYQGATVSTGIVSANGEVYLSGIPAKGRLHAIWGNESSQQCLADINMPPAGNTTSSTVLSLNVLCD